MGKKELFVLYWYCSGTAPVPCFLVLVSIFHNSANFPVPVLALVYFIPTYQVRYDVLV